MQRRRWRNHIIPSFLLIVWYLYYTKWCQWIVLLPIHCWALWWVIVMILYSLEGLIATDSFKSEFISKADSAAEIGIGGYEGKVFPLHAPWYLRMPFWNNSISHQTICTTARQPQKEQKTTTLLNFLTLNELHEFRDYKISLIPKCIRVLFVKMNNH